jgi:hypothetical protein
MNPHFERFHSWLTANGFSRDKWQHRVQVQSFGEQGFGLVSTTPMHERDVILSIPEAILMTTRTAKQCPHVAQVVETDQRLNRERSNPISDTELLCLHLVVEQLRGDESFWKPYIDVLPRTYSLLCTIAPQSLSLIEIATPSTTDTTRHRILDALTPHVYRCQSAVDSSYTRIARLLPALPPSPTASLLSDNMTRDLWLWAYCTVSSRSCHVPFDSVGALVPFGDFLNHESVPPSDPPVCRPLPTLNTTTKTYDFFAHRAFAPGEQVYVCYSTHDNLHLMEFYGFALPHNPYDRVPIALPEAHELAPSHTSATTTTATTKYSRKPRPTAQACSDGKLEALRRSAEASMHTSDLFVYPDSGPSCQLMCALRIRALDQVELCNKLYWRALQDLQVSERNEQIVRAYLERVVSQLLVDAQAVLHRVHRLRQQPQLQHQSEQLHMIAAWISSQITVLQSCDPSNPTSESQQ